tara:strand:- start:94 stop:693 length:600 start_codon:yes stop_codon:yes gene_type:complete
MLDYNKIEKMEGWGRQSVSNLKYSIDSRKIITLDRFIFALGIRHIGFENAKLIAKNLKSFDTFFNLSKSKNFQDLLNIDGMGETQINSMKSFFSNQTNLKVIKDLSKLISIEDNVNFKKNGPLKNKAFMFTGKLKDISRAEAKSLIENNSGSIVSNVSKKLNYLIIGDKPTKNKIDKAKELKVKILSQEEWFKMLDKTT